MMRPVVLPKDGLVIGGMQADRFSEVRYPASFPGNGDVGENSNPTQDDRCVPATEERPVDSSRWTVRLGHNVYGAIDNWLVGHLSSRLERWLLGGSTDGDSPVLRRSFLLWGFVVSLLATVLGVFTPRFNPADALNAWLIPGLFISMFIFVVVNFAALQISTRVIVEPRKFIGILPSHWSPYSCSKWSDTTNPDVVEILGSRRSKALSRLSRTVMTVLRFVLIGFSGVFVYLLFQLVRSTPSLVGIPAVLVIVLVWFVLSDILRSRRRVVVRSAVVRGIQVLMVVGVGGLLLRLPTLAFYNELGATDLALKVSWTEAAFHAVPLVAVVLGSAVFVCRSGCWHRGWTGGPVISSHWL
ncbi:hypothetical protein [Rhodococcus wratislaviensis]|uniref:hypothetical protein n=1 Tax=Rhodococcus wratislaviensis TaxID=44752 RepID=UPI0011BF1E2E|nr:hypothetical protein [Rhodococcus wratislaviensis]